MVCYFEKELHCLKEIINYHLYILATKVSLDISDNSSDILGISAVIINDLRRRRQRDYEFNWNAAFDVRFFLIFALIEMNYFLPYYYLLP